MTNEVALKTTKDWVDQIFGGGERLQTAIRNSKLKGGKAWKEVMKDPVQKGYCREVEAVLTYILEWYVTLCMERHDLTANSIRAAPNREWDRRKLPAASFESIFRLGTPNCKGLWWLLHDGAGEDPAATDASNRLGIVDSVFMMPSSYHSGT